MKMKEAIARQDEPLRSELERHFRKFPADGEVMLRSFKANATIVREGDPVTLIYILLSGSFAVSWSESGQGQYLTFHTRPLAYVGELAALGGFPEYTATVYTKTQSRFLAMGQELFLNWLEHDLPSYRKLVHETILMLHYSASNSRSAVSNSNSVRILEFLRWYFHRYAGGESGNVLVQMTRQTMVSEIGGLSLRSLNRYLAQLQEQSLIGMYKGKVQITQQQYARIVEALEEKNL